MIEDHHDDYLLRRLLSGRDAESGLHHRRHQFRLAATRGANPQQLAQLLEDTHYAVRAAAARKLPDGDPRLDELARCDDHTKVRCAAVVRASVEAQLECARSTSAELRCAVARVATDPEVIEAVIETSLKARLHGDKAWMPIYRLAQRPQFAQRALDAAQDMDALGSAIRLEAAKTIQAAGVNA